MMKRYLPIVILLLVSTTNVQSKTIKYNTKVIEVAPYLVECVGVGSMQCMQVRDNGQKEWELMYDQIAGFQFKPGYLYKLQVRVKPVRNSPADASSVSWSLVKVISKKSQAIN